MLAYHTKPVIPEVNQPGGIISLGLNSTVSTVFKSGKDEVLGRWSWMTLRGKNNIQTTIITGYRPCDNPSGPDSVYLQQQRYLNANQINTCPRELWLKDLTQFVKQKLEEGQQIIVMADMNDSVQQKLVSIWANKIGLVEVVSKTVEVEVPTHQRGKKALDGIFMSHSLQPTQAGYFPFGEMQSDHRTLWVDIHHDNLFGFSPPKGLAPQARRLQSNVPKIRNRFLFSAHTSNFEFLMRIFGKQLDNVHSR